MTERVLLVFGGRTLHPRLGAGHAQQLLTSICFDRLGGKPDRVIQGGARGYDLAAKLWSQAHKIPCDEYPADWARYGRRAGPIRNRKMLEEGRPTLAIGFPGGRGTADMTRRVRQAKVPLVEVEPEPDRGGT